MCVRITALVTYNYESVLEKVDFAINLYVLPPPYSLQHSKVNCCCFKYSNELSLTWNINERLKGLKHVSKKRMSQLWLSNKYFPFVGASLITLYLYGQSSFYWLTGFLSVSMCEQVFPLLWFFTAEFSTMILNGLIVTQSPMEVMWPKISRLFKNTVKK